MAEPADGKSSAGFLVPPAAISVQTPYAKKGSQRWLQVAVDRAPEALNVPLRTAMGLPVDMGIEWLSPVRAEKFIEYRDGATYTKYAKGRVDLSRRALQDFWPSGGPVWDGLAQTDRGDVLLVEAKAHIPEIVSGRTRATPTSRSRIAKSMRAVQEAIAPRSVDLVDWTGTFYQYANRLAHLHFLREDNGVRAHLVNVYFLNADDVAGPSDRAEWDGALKVVECYLGLGRHRLSKYVHKLFVDVTPLKTLA